MIDRLTSAELKGLIETHAEWCVSLYLPTHRSLPETRQDPVRFKNLLREVENALAAGGLRSPEIREFLKPAQELLDDSPFWQHQADGLAAFLSAGEFHNYRLPISFPELSVVGERFHLKPLLPLLSGNNRFFVLALSQNNVRLIEGTSYGASEVDLENVPGSLKEILGSYDVEEQLQFRTQQKSGERSAIFHGHGGGRDEMKSRISEYFRQIVEGVHAKLKNESAPLVLAGVESLFPLYREVNTFKSLLDEGIAGNPELLSAEELRQRAWSIVEPRFLRQRQEAENRYHTLAGTGKTSTDLQEVVTAAYDGRIDALFVAAGVQIWGNFNQDERSLTVHEQAEKGDVDLSDVCAVRTFLSNGEVFAVEANAVPGGGPIAALFRY